MAFWDDIGETILKGIGTGVPVAGQLATANDQRLYGAQSLATSQFEAQQYAQEAGQQQAAGEHQAFFANRNSQMLQSQALAYAAASGGGASDPTVVRTISQIAGQGAYNQAMDLYGGNERARQLNLQGQATLMQGQMRAQTADAAAFGSDIGAFAAAERGAAVAYDAASRTSSFLSGRAGDASMYQRFGMGGPSLAG